MAAVVYRIVHAGTGRCYVGHTTNYQARMSSHLGLLAQGTHHSPYLQRAWSKHGASSFRFEVLEECSDEEKLGREQHWMDRLDSCFNLARVAGSRKGVPHRPETVRKIVEGRSWYRPSDETKEKIGQAVRGHNRSMSRESAVRISKALRGRAKSEETKRRMSQAKMGHLVSAETREKLRAATLAHYASRPS